MEMIEQKIDAIYRAMDEVFDVEYLKMLSKDVAEISKQKAIVKRKIRRILTE